MADIKDKIAKLLALAGSPNENEAKAAMLKARELMAENKLGPDDISGIKNIPVIRRTIGVTYTEMFTPWVHDLADIIAAHYCCKIYRSRTKGAKKHNIGLVGLQDDFEICEKVYRYALCFVMSACQSIRSDLRGKDASYIRKATIAYGDGFCAGLQNAYDAQDSEHQEWGLVLLVPKEVKEAMTSMKIEKRRCQVDLSGHKRFVLQGFQAGESFDPSSCLRTAIHD